MNYYDYYVTFTNHNPVRVRAMSREDAITKALHSRIWGYGEKKYNKKTIISAKRITE